MNFEWKDRNRYYEVVLYDGDKKFANMCFWDFTNPNQLEFDKSHKYTRAFAFQANFCDNNLQFSSKTYFDGDKKFDKHYDKNGEKIYGYQGNPIHTADEIKRWCEEYLSSIY